MPAPGFPTRPTVAPAVSQVAGSLAAAGHRAWLAGEELARAWWAPPGPGPRTHRIVTSAPLAVVLERLPRAVVIHARGLMLPSAAGAIDLVVEQRLPEALADFGFSLHTIAWDPVDGTLIDPCDGLADARCGRLRLVGDPAEQLARSPVLALRALRLVAELGLEPDPSLGPALGTAALETTARLRAAARSELLRMLCGSHAGRALELAASSGLAKQLAPAADPSVAHWIDALAPRVELRLAVWLGTGAAAWLRDWRLGLGRSQRVLELAQHHPIDEAASPRHDAAVGRLLRRLGPEDRADLQAARAAQLASGVLAPEVVRRASARLAALGEAFARVERNREAALARAGLALSGAQVMEQLACGPGPLVGRALRHLAEICAADATRNTEAALRAALDEWVASAPSD